MTLAQMFFDPDYEVASIRNHGGTPPSPRIDSRYLRDETQAADFAHQHGFEVYSDWSQVPSGPWAGWFSVALSYEQIAA